MSDQTSFEQIFAAFRAKFPPVKELQRATLQLSTSEIREMITDFAPEVLFPEQGITQFMIDQGYKFEPIEFNDRVRFLWLIG